jgi:hypothetical protein
MPPQSAVDTAAVHPKLFERLAALTARDFEFHKRFSHIRD